MRILKSDVIKHLSTTDPLPNGISVWQRRSSETVDADDIYQQSPAADNDARLQQSHWILLPKKQLSEAALRLLTAMLKAINLSLDNVALFDGSEIEMVKKAATGSHRILILDEAITKRNDMTAQCFIAAPALQTLLDTPARKREAWQALQQYAGQG